LAARTLHEGEAREHSSTVQRSDVTPLPGSLDETAALVEAEGRRALPVFMDLTDRTTLEPAVDEVLSAWGRIDVLVNNGRYIGPGHMDQLLDTPVELLDLHLEANVMAPVILTKLVLPQMLERGDGYIVVITSGAGASDPPAPAGEGGWGLGYAMSKGAVHRLAGIVAVELGDRGIVGFNLHPGFVTTERILIDMAPFGFDGSTGAPPDVIGAACAWLVTEPEARALNGTWIEGQELCAARKLLPGWPA
jgi:NAD(P)-dependent dehydrogenase (short-subunit alcohol dehydrogenase family)